MPNWRCGYERWTEGVALNAKLKDAALNAKLEIWLWMLRWRRDSERRMEERHDDSECQTKKKTNDGSKHQTKNEQRLWMPNGKYGFEYWTEGVALNAELKWTTALNGKRKMWWLWMSN